MAIATNGGHVSRALDFYKSAGKYLIIGGTQPWINSEGAVDETTPATPQPTDFKLRDVVALKKIENTYLVIPDDSGSIEYNKQKWKIIPETLNTSISQTGVTAASTVISVTSVEGITVGSKLRVNNTYEGKVVSISGLLVTLDTAAPTSIPGGSPVVGGAMVEGAKYVYVEAHLNYDEFPLVTYRQIGLCTGVTPNTSDILKAAAYTTTNRDEFSSLGILEILDNRVPGTRDSAQRELISFIIEF